MILRHFVQAVSMRLADIATFNNVVNRRAGFLYLSLHPRQPMEVSDPGTVLIWLTMWPHLPDNSGTAAIASEFGTGNAVMGIR